MSICRCRGGVAEKNCMKKWRWLAFDIQMHANTALLVSEGAAHFPHQTRRSQREGLSGALAPHNTSPQTPYIHYTHYIGYIICPLTSSETDYEKLITYFLRLKLKQNIGISTKWTLARALKLSQRLKRPWWQRLRKSIEYLFLYKIFFLQIIVKLTVSPAKKIFIRVQIRNSL